MHKRASANRRHAGRSEFFQLMARVVPRYNHSMWEWRTRGRGHKNIAKCPDWRLKRTICPPLMEEIYVDAVLSFDACVTVSGSFAMEISTLRATLRPCIKLDEYSWYIFCFLLYLNRLKFYPFQSMWVIWSIIV